MSAFPIDLLPESIRSAILAQCAIGGFHVEAVGPAALAVVSFATQALANVDCLHTPNVSFPLSNLFMVVQRSGDAKSTTYNKLMHGVTAWQDKALESYDLQMVEYTASHASWEIEYQNAKKIKEVDVRKLALARLLTDQPRRPADPRNLLSKTTTNGIYSTLERGWPTLGIFTSEGGSLLGGHSLRKENSPAEFASMLTMLWDGAPIDRTTGEVSIRLRGRRMTGLIFVQDSVASNFLNDPMMKTQGIHARFLLAFPPNWASREADFTSDENQHRLQSLETKLQPFHDRVEILLNHPLRTYGDDRRELRPVTIGWDMESRRHLTDWYNTVALKWRREESESFFGRALEHAQRLAAAMTVFDDWHNVKAKLDPDADVDAKLDWWRENRTPPAPVITLANAKAATALVEYFAAQLLAMNVPATDERQTSQADHIERIMKFMTKTGTPVSMRDLARGPCQRLDLKFREAILDAMIRDEYISAIEATNGSKKTTYYQIKEQ